jgi:hypothetical protein
MAPRWSRSPTESGCREDGPEEGGGDTSIVEGAERSPSSQASASNGIKEEGGLMANETEAWTQLATRIPKELHRRLKLHCDERHRPHALRDGGD